jgi:hypothetical protein
MVSWEPIEHRIRASWGASCLPPPPSFLGYSSQNPRTLAGNLRLRAARGRSPWNRSPYCNAYLKISYTDLQDSVPDTGDRRDTAGARTHTHSHTHTPCAHTGRGGCCRRGVAALLQTPLYLRGLNLALLAGDTPPPPLCGSCCGGGSEKIDALGWFLMSAGC